MEEQFGTYLFEYAHEGAEWSFTIKARDEADAIARVEKLSTYGRYMGVVQMTLPASLGWFGRIIVAWKNWRQP